ncbi:oxygen-independent coproporphyrinogen III oxidase [Halomonas sp. M5N1S17]|uniref:oxygen-independent coproporphyrinogen III oxidase n=1 Tax=Halomonas alkalisoli TaxID=2907158 RepID=UPI001F177413|nr:oxygen-independent coproporphyrinogen III oxidase [Halomonas alkalisoli]MCE9665431.1 oxygen-independent coproporphyrinogen III oxidase [Halomonas alkalisoli]
MSVPAMFLHGMLADPFAWDEALLRRYDIHGSNYASYPTTHSFQNDIGEVDYQRALARSNDSGRPLSLYVHLPFCRKACHHCASIRTITKATRITEPYLSRLDREMVLVRSHLDTRREVTQLHWGGGTPTFFSLDQMSDLIDRLNARFGLSSSRDRDYSIEIDPREADVFTLRHLQALGFNRLRLGVQDLDPKVQRAINRVQPRVLTETLLDEADRLGFRSLTLDLVYGLPFQTRDSFAATLEQVIAMAPARLSIFNYAHMPSRFGSQRRIRREDLPGPEEKLAILRAAITMLTDAGYVHIGIGHFARPRDSLVAAQRQGTLQHGFQGYSSHGRCDLVGLGVSAISYVDGVYAQNPLSLGAYEAALDASHLATTRGIRQTFDDRVRHHAIERLICDMQLDLGKLGERFGIDATRYLADALTRLEAPARDGLLAWEGDLLVATPIGRLLIRHLAMAFDSRLPDSRPPDSSS